MPPENPKLKRLTRRRRQLVGEKVRLGNRLHSDLLPVRPELLAITGDVTNLGFLRFLSSQDDLRELRSMSEEGCGGSGGSGRSTRG